MGACSDSLKLEDRRFLCGPALPCAPGYSCSLDPEYNTFVCTKNTSSPPSDTLSDTAIPDGTSQDANEPTDNQSPLDDTTVGPIADIPSLSDTMPDPGGFDMEEPDWMVGNELMEPDMSMGDLVSPNDPDTGLGLDAGNPTTPCIPGEDTLCFTPCEKWGKINHQPTASPPGAMFIDLGGNGTMETVLHSGHGITVLDTDGTIIWEEVDPNTTTFARGAPVAADLTPPDTMTPFVKELSILTTIKGEGHVLSYMVGPGVEQTDFKVSQPLGPVYDLARFIASDFDFDGQPEFIASQGCSPAVWIFEAQDEGKEIAVEGAFNFGGNSCDYNGGRLLTDLDGQGSLELLVGLGFANHEKTEWWDGKIQVVRLVDVWGNFMPFCENCFETDIANLYPSGVTDLFRQGDTIHAVVQYFKSKLSPEPGGIFYHWRYSTSGVPLGTPAQIDSSQVPLSVSITNKSALLTVPELRTIGLYDVNGDSFPDRIRTDDKDLILELYDKGSNTFIEHQSARLAIGEKAHIGSIWDRNNDQKLDVLVTDANGSLHCLELGKNTYNRDGSIPPYDSPYYRTYQKDNYEPNDGLPLGPNIINDPRRIPWLPSNLTALGRAWSYLESEDDVDYFQVKVVGNSEICVRSPMGVEYEYEFSVWFSPQTISQPPLWTSADALASGKSPYTKCVKPVDEPALNGFFSVIPGSIMTLIIGVTSNGPVTSHRPYWIDTPNILAGDGINFGGG
jgi:hypothetical protein